MRFVEKIARFDNTHIYSHHRSVKCGGEYDGRYVRVGNLFRLGVPTLDKQQYVGIHKNLVLTMGRPYYAKDLLSVAADLPAVEGIGNITWLGTSGCSTAKKSVTFFIPKPIWGFIDGDYDKIIRTSSTLSVVEGARHGQYFLLSIPLISRKFLRDRYKKVSLTPHSQTKGDGDAEVAPADDKR